MILLHIDGSGDNQWADILNNNRVAIPMDLVPYRRTENLMRPVVDNMVAYHTTMPFRFVAEAKHDRRSRERGQIDTAFANHIAKTQRLNTVFAEAMYMAAAAGFCPVHAYWRNDLSFDPYEPLYLQDYEGFLPRKGIIDAWCGNPFDTTFNPGARRGSVQTMWYGRCLPADLVRRAFEQTLHEQGVTLEGDDKLPSSAAFQRIARNWWDINTSVHGTHVMSAGGDGDGEELIALVCREVAPGVDREYPNGRLTIVALQGSATTDSARRGGTGEAILLADQPLPAGRFSAENVYSHWRFDDVHGKAFAEDIDGLQVQLNLALSDRKEYIKRSIKAPTIVGGRLIEDMAEYDGYTLLEMEPGQGNTPPQVLQLPAAPAHLLTTDIAELRQAIYTIGGYQAASRGEAKSGQPYRAIVALQSADDTVHGPTNVVFKQTVCDFMQLCWSLMKTYGDVPWVLDAVGDDFEHMGEMYVNNARLSESPPTYRLTNSFGVTPENRAEQLQALVAAKGADGEPLLRTAEFRKQWPDQSLYDASNDPAAMQRRRARNVVFGVRTMVERASKQTGVQGRSMADPAVQQLARSLFPQVEQTYQRLRDDDLAAHIAAYTETIQDETEDPAVRLILIWRQEKYYEWQAEQAMAQQQAAVQQTAPPSAGQPAARPVAGYTPKPTSPNSLSPSSILAEMHKGQPVGA